YASSDFSGMLLQFDPAKFHGAEGDGYASSDFSGMLLQFDPAKFHGAEGDGYASSDFSGVLIDSPFTEMTTISTVLTNVENSSVAWGDYDNDGDLDILLSGDQSFNSPVTEIYRYDGSAYTAIANSLTDVSYGSVAWGDYDNDGDLDILLTGMNNSNNAVSEIYDNSGSPSFTFSLNSAASETLKNVYRSSAAWGDYDNDGDLDILLTGRDDNVELNSRVYQNTFYGFTEDTAVSAVLPGVQNGSVAWADYDNDHDLDILLSGDNGTPDYKFADIFENDGGIFSPIDAGLQPVANSSVAWGDYDSDGDPDILLTGMDVQGAPDPNYPVAKIYENDGPPFFTFSENTSASDSLKNVHYSSVAWGDFDTNGYFDILLTGDDGVNPVTKIYSQAVAGIFSDINANLTAVSRGCAAWGDYDNDGDLDILLTGREGVGNTFPVAVIYRNNEDTPNTMPDVPTGLQATVAAAFDNVILSWDPGNDSETLSPGLTYNLRVGTTPGGIDIVSPMTADMGGVPNLDSRQIVALGSQYYNTGWSLDINGLAPGSYYWSVQALDNNFAGSLFATESIFQVDVPGIDLGSASASFWGQTATDTSGCSVSDLGDVNGDGYDDFLIGAKGNDDGGNEAGKAYLVLGKATGWIMDTDLGTVDASFIGENEGDLCGYSVAGPGDVNGDGFNDLLISAYLNNGGGIEAGKTYLIFGKASGWALNTDLSTADASFSGEDDLDSAGWSVSGAGDVNGDGYDDFLIAALYDEDGGTDAGQTYLLLGKNDGWTLDTNLSLADASFIGENAYDQSGWSLSSAGDVNGDGYDDFLIAARANGDNGTFAGQVYLILGKAGGWAMDTNLSAADASFIGESADEQAGYSVSDAGDVNSDGYDDILIGAHQNDGANNFFGQAYLVLGKDSGWTMDTNLSAADASFISDDAGSQHGISVSGSGDVNGDGFDDFLIGIYAADSDGNYVGQTYLIIGQTGGWAMGTDLSTAGIEYSGENPDDWSGWPVSGAGDVNGDGFNDFLIAARGNDEGGNEAGQTYLLLSDTVGPVNGVYTNFVDSGDTPAIRYPNANARVDFSDAVSGGGFLVITEHNNQIPPDTGGLPVFNRYWDFSPFTLTSYTYDVTFKYNNGEIGEAGGDESKLHLFRNDGSGWQAVSTVIDPPVNEIHAYDQTTFSAWAVGNTDSSLAPLFSTIGDFVWHDLNGNGIQESGENGLEGITVGLYDTTGIIQGSSTSNTNGYYSFSAIPEGEYFLQFAAFSGYAFSPQDVGQDDSLDSDADPADGRTMVFATAVGVDNLNWDAGLNAIPIITQSIAILNYTENDPPLVIDSQLNLIDDNPDLIGAVVRINENFAVSEDILHFSDQNDITGF
ncbi:MAG: hypothetical protein GY869_25390, partial [Planctomycetes bacterium]|nr:hypothetical protein [Planctomycetota bacterium]